MDDLEFRDRMKRAYMIASMVTINLKGRLEQIRAAVMFCELHKDFAWGPTLVATSALLYGRQYGLWECGAIGRIDTPDPDNVESELKGQPELREQLRELQEVAADAVGRVAEELKFAMGQAHAAAVLSEWEGFGRFCRSHLSTEPLTVMRAYGLLPEDPAAQVLATYPDAKVDEAKAEERAGHWARGWERRFPK
jgi:hypothetical protein